MSNQVLRRVLLLVGAAIGLGSSFVPHTVCAQTYVPYQAYYRLNLVTNQLNSCVVQWLLEVEKKAGYVYMDQITALHLAFDYHHCDGEVLAWAEQCVFVTHRSTSDFAATAWKIVTDSTEETAKNFE